MNSRKEFERNMFLLQEGFRRDEISISNSNVRTIRGIQNARLSPNQRGNLNTVDEMARLTATMFNNMMHVNREKH
ncbi:hypothetical protein C5O19_22095 [Siphonobacter curvatus]|uniref:Uncharacterized protein n=1 Tax=Siphonobacter curvatus TaxID=2094562 RepID=A0A2S7IGM8_9BACT|nr:hypothetical protein C5O19_22095 [Siphonobacter curvatus]